MNCFRRSGWLMIALRGIVCESKLPTEILSANLNFIPFNVSNEFQSCRHKSWKYFIDFYLPPLDTTGNIKKWDLAIPPSIQEISAEFCDWYWTYLVTSFWCAFTGKIKKRNLAIPPTINIILFKKSCEWYLLVHSGCNMYSYAENIATLIKYFYIFS